MDNQFPYHYRLLKGTKFNFEYPSSNGRKMETFGSTRALRISFPSGDELFQRISLIFLVHLKFR
ncbi:hypothetical protein [Liquorilactobacillus hordei]|uniref:hypothetical protein n=1 Tax=Liquorilactobacillus hordei TaxID=468911 RepID=UPI0039E843F2